MKLIILRAITLTALPINPRHAGIKEDGKMKAKLRSIARVVKAAGMVFEGTLKYLHPVHGPLEVSKLIIAADRGDALAKSREYFAHECNVDFYIPEKGCEIFKHTVLTCDMI